MDAKDQRARLEADCDLARQQREEKQADLVKQIEAMALRHGEQMREYGEILERLTGRVDELDRQKYVSPETASAIRAAFGRSPGETA